MMDDDDTYSKMRHMKIAKLRNDGRNAIQMMVAAGERRTALERQRASRECMVMHQPDDMYQTKAMARKDKALGECCGSGQSRKEPGKVASCTSQELANAAPDCCFS